MKPAWDTLMKEYEGHASALVGDVDCTAAGKPLCDSNGVQGFPTIKHGDPSDLQDYKGGRDLDAMQKFAQENLKPLCSPSNIELCDDAQKAEIDKFKAMPSEELDKAIAEKDAEAAATEVHFKAETDKLQKRYQELQKNKESALEAVTKSGLAMMKAVKAAPVKCMVKSHTNCSDKEKSFIDKMSSKSAADVAKQVARLEKMKGDSMKAELKAWLLQRLAILKQL